MSQNSHTIQYKCKRSNFTKPRAHIYLTDKLHLSSKKDLYSFLEKLNILFVWLFSLWNPFLQV